MRLQKKPHVRACWGATLGNDTHGGSTTKMGIGEEAGESYGKSSFLPALRRMLKVIHRETRWEGFTQKKVKQYISQCPMAVCR